MRLGDRHVSYGRSSCRQQFAHVTLHSFFFNDTATTEIYTLSLHDALPILFMMKWKTFILPGKLSMGEKTHFCLPVAASIANNFRSGEVQYIMPFTIIGLHCICE